MRSRSKAWRVLTVLGLAAAAMGPLTAAQGAQSSPVESDATYEIRSQASGKCLDVKDASEANGAPIVQWTCNGGTNQRFRLFQEPNGYWSFRTFAHKFLAVKDIENALDGSPITQIAESDTTEANSTFDIVWDQVTADVYRIWVPANDANRFFDVKDGSQADGAPIIQYVRTEGPNQLFKMVKVA
ncbi:RICIN domain-containing protein [Streptomyces xanthochromogenes]|uniref:RICIN domain-containing protein n=1 Tax=Streptomyces xanthochromogenes TaxID=67384 RepID=UPI003425FB1A